MSIKLINEVLDHAPADWTQTERLFVAVLAEKARVPGRRSWPGQTAIARRTGLKGDSVTRLCHRLAAKGWELREKVGEDKNGKPLFAHNGQAVVYVVPKLCPFDEHVPDVCFPKARTVVRASGVEDPALAEESPDGGPGFVEESPDDSPPLTGGSPDHRPVVVDQDPDGGPVFTAEARTVVRESPDGGPPLTVMNPQRPNRKSEAAEPTTAEAGDVITVTAADIVDPSTHPAEMINKPRPVKYPPNTTDRMPANPPRTGRQVGLFSAKTLALPERAQIVYDWLRWNGYPEATEDDARQIDAMIKREWPGKTPGYLRGVAGPNGSGFATWYQRIRAERAERVEVEIRDMERSKPRCEHGTLAGREPHPTHGTPLCPACRRSLPARESEATTHPATSAALAAYTDVFTDQLTAADVVMLAQQFEALRVQGATSDQLVRLAATAAAANVAPLVAATRKDV